MDDEIQSRLESEAKRKWNLQFGRHETLARHKSEDKKREEAVLCFHDTMEKTIDQYDENFSGGCYLKLSDENPPKIGWHIDWKTMY